MIIYLLQTKTSDPGLQLKTEITSQTVDQLLFLAKHMVRNNPLIKGMSYNIFKIIKEDGPPCACVCTLHGNGVFSTDS